MKEDIIDEVLVEMKQDAVFLKISTEMLAVLKHETVTKISDCHEGAPGG